MKRDHGLCTDFEAFCNKSFSIANPGADLNSSWHIQSLGATLEEARKSNVKRLLVHMPPRSLKSQCISVMWPAWIMACNPFARLMTASYSQRLSEKHALDSRHVMRSQFYRDMFPHTRILPGQDQKNKFMTTERGYRLTTSVGGTATGEGGNYLIIDDPHNPQHIHSASRRRAVIDWFEQTWCSRLDNKEEGVMIIVMQRLHHDDLAGYLMSKPNSPWESVTLQAQATRSRMVYVKGLAYRQEKGELLQPGRDTQATLDQIKHEMGAYHFAAQYQQEPAVQGGNVVKREWLRVLSQEEVSACDPRYLILSWDTALQTGAHNDYSVCAVWAVCADRYILLDVYREKIPFHLLTAKAVAFADQWKPKEIWIENKFSGQVLVQHLQQHHPELPVVGLTPKLDKLSRLMQVVALLEQGKVAIAEASWTDDFLKELCNFPHDPHDDQVDAVTQFLQRMQEQEQKRVMPKVWTI